MLILSRKRDEKIELQGGLVEITVVDIRGDKVRLGITAPPEISIHRKEVADAMRAKAASDGDAAGCAGA
jgi:carbon storage regulator